MSEGEQVPYLVLVASGLWAICSPSWAQFLFLAVTVPLVAVEVWLVRCDNDEQVREGIGSE